MMGGYNAGYAGASSSSASAREYNMYEKQFLLTDEQYQIANDLMGQGVCSFCERELGLEDRKGLLVQPFSAFHKDRRMMKAIVICQQCFFVVNAAILKCKGKK